MRPSTQVGGTVYLYWYLLPLIFIHCFYLDASTLVTHVISEVPQSTVYGLEVSHVCGIVPGVCASSLGNISQSNLGS